MGAYLHIGFVAKATTQLPTGIPNRKLLKTIEAYYPADTYDCIQSDGEIALTLKPEVVQKELLPFVRRVYQDFHSSDDGGILKKALAFIRENAGHPDWLEKTEAADLYEFSLIDYGLSDDFEIAGKEVCLYTTNVALGSEGKFSMEESAKTLRFMETCAHRAYIDWRLGKTFRVFVL